VLKGGHIQYQDENGKDVTIDQFNEALQEWFPFINSLRMWRKGLFTITLTEWNQMPPILKELIDLHDRIVSEIKPKKQK
jgi:hypothetical protein